MTAISEIAYPSSHRVVTANRSHEWFIFVHTVRWGQFHSKIRLISPGDMAIGVFLESYNTWNQSTKYTTRCSRVTSLLMLQKWRFMALIDSIGGDGHLDWWNAFTQQHLTQSTGSPASAQTYRLWIVSSSIPSTALELCCCAAGECRHFTCMVQCVSGMCRT